MSGTSLRHFRYMFDISDTCPRQINDFRDICQRFQIYVRNIRPLSNTANWCQGHLSDTLDICPIYKTPLWETSYLSHPAPLSSIAATCLRLLHADSCLRLLRADSCLRLLHTASCLRLWHADSCLRLLQTSASDCRHISESADHLTIQLSGTGDIHPLHSFLSLNKIPFKLSNSEYQFIYFNFQSETHLNLTLGLFSLEKFNLHVIEYF
jgi:hypothetical protein